MFSQPKHIKEGHLLLKGVRKFIHYKSDLLPRPVRDRIDRARDDLEDAVRAGDGERIKTAGRKAAEACEKALPAPRGSHGIRENVEVFFVTIVIVLGIRAFFVQPFKIPTGSMQPTLNGIIATQTAPDAPEPGFLGKAFNRVFRSRSYIHVVADRDGRLRERNPITEEKLINLGNLRFITRSVIHFEDGHTIGVFAPQDKLIQGLGLGDVLGLSSSPIRDAFGRPALTPDGQMERRWFSASREVTKGQVLAHGTIETGDHVLVDKFSYHFRKPKRGEVFVFTTKDIAGIEASPSFDPRFGSQHYIKRLAGVPGDHLEVKPPELWINGVVATEPGFVRVMTAADRGYRGYFPPETDVNLQPGQYFAMGDNSASSFDGRMWGPVPERNLVGPAMFVYWPFVRHFGPIR